MEIGLKDTWVRLCSRYTGDSLLIAGYLKEIEDNYGHEKRYYHNLRHIENLIQQLYRAKALISNEDALVFAAFYHDLIYDTTRSDNEEKSAAIARGRLQKLNVPEHTINTCDACILATRMHTRTDETDCNIFTDADLSILGAPMPVYKAYAKQIRMEYSAVPDELYRDGRKNVLERILQMEAIFKTPFFREELETEARKNIRNEIEFPYLSEF